jgi:hypothetical protein
VPNIEGKKMEINRGQFFRGAECGGTCPKKVGAKYIEKKKLRARHCAPIEQ